MVPTRDSCPVRYWSALHYTHFMHLTIRYFAASQCEPFNDHHVQSTPVYSDPAGGSTNAANVRCSLRYEGRHRLLDQQSVSVSHINVSGRTQQTNNEQTMQRSTTNTSRRMIDVSTLLSCFCAANSFIICYVHQHVIFVQNLVRNLHWILRRSSFEYFNFTVAPYNF